MIEFLTEHKRYSTTNGMGFGSSYANNIKVPHVGIPSDVDQDTAYEMVTMPDWHAAFNVLINSWTIDQNEAWTVCVGGRSGGYMVLTKQLRHEVRGPKRSDAPTFKYHPTTQDVDGDRDYAEWSLADIRERVKLVCSFDELCDNVVETFFDICREFEIVTETIKVPKKIRVLRER